MESQSLGRIRNAALKVVSARTQTQARTSRAIEEETLPTRQPIYRCHVAVGESPNEAAQVVLLDSRAREVELPVPEPPPASLPSAERPPHGGVLHAGTPVSIHPAQNLLTLNSGDSHIEAITVTVPKSAGAARVDIYFLANTIGSIGSILNAVKTKAATVLSSLNTLDADFHFGVGNYRDFPSRAYGSRP